MTTELLEPAPAYTIQSTGPFGIPHPYQAAEELRVVVVEQETGIETELTPLVDFTVDPSESDAEGNLFLTAGAYTLHAGRRIVIQRATFAEQGWEALTGPRETGLEAQLDRLTQCIQDVDARAARALRFPAGDDASPILPLGPAGTVMIVREDGKGYETGPQVDDISEATTAAAASATQAATSAGQAATSATSAAASATSAAASATAAAEAAEQANAETAAQVAADADAAAASATAAATSETNAAASATGAAVSAQGAATSAADAATSATNAAASETAIATAATEIDADIVQANQILADVTAQAGSAIDQVGKYRPYNWQVNGKFVDGAGTATPKGYSEMSGMQIVAIAGEAGLSAHQQIRYAAKCTTGTGTRRLLSFRLDCQPGDVFIPSYLYASLADISGTVNLNVSCWFADNTGALITPATTVQQSVLTAPGNGTWTHNRGEGASQLGYIVAPNAAVQVLFAYDRTGTGTGTTYISRIFVERIDLEDRRRGEAVLTPILFGCSGNGTTNDTAKMQKAAAAATALRAPLHFRDQNFYLIDHVDFGDDCILTGRAQLISSGYNIKANLPSQRHVVRIGKRGRYETIEYQHSQQTGYENDPASPSYDTGIAGQLFLDDYSDGDCLALTGVSPQAGSVALFTGHGNRCGFIDTSLLRADPVTPTTAKPTGALQPAQASNGVKRPVVVNGEWSQNSKPVAKNLFADTPSTISEGFRLDGYKIRFAWRAFSLDYTDRYAIGPGSISGLHVGSEISPGYNGFLIASCRGGHIAPGEVSDMGEHAIRVSSNNRRGSWDLTFGIMTSKRCGASVIKINGGGGGEVYGKEVAGTPLGDANYHPSYHNPGLTRSRRIKVAGLNIVDPFADIPLGLDGSGKAPQLIRVSHCDTFECGPVNIDLENAAAQDGDIAAITSAQNVYIGPVKSATNAHVKMRPVNFNATNDIDDYDILQDTRRVHLDGWDVRLTYGTDTGQKDAYVRVRSDTGNAFVAGAKIGDVRLTNWFFMDTGALLSIGTFTGVANAAIYVDGIVSPSKDLLWSIAGDSKSCIVDIVDLAGASTARKFGQAHSVLAPAA